MLYDYHCGSCGTTGEVFAEADQHQIRCSCGHTAQRVWRSFGGMMGKNKGIYPRFDVQLGITLESSQHMEKVAKERGLAVMSNEDFKRSQNTAHEPEKKMVDGNDPAWKDACEKAYNDTMSGNIPLKEAPPLDDSYGTPVLESTGIKE